MTQNNKICLNFETGEEAKGSDFLIMGNGNKIIIKTDNCTDSKLKTLKDWYGNITDICDLIDAELSLGVENEGLWGFKFTDCETKSKDSDPIFQKYPLLLELQKKLGFDVYGEYVFFEDDSLTVNCNTKLELEHFNLHELKTIASVIMRDLRGDWNCNYLERIEKLVPILEQLLKLDETNANQYKEYLETARRELSGDGRDDGRVFRDCVRTQESLYRYADDGKVNSQVYNYFIQIINNTGNSHSIDDIQDDIKYKDIIQELSKHYKGEENKFDEVGNILRL